MIEYDLSIAEQYIFDEKGNQFESLAMESWNGRPAKLSLRKYTINKEGKEIPNKGFSFLTPEGPSRLAEELVRRGYGDTNILLNILKDRDDVNSDEIEDMQSDDEYFDPKDIFAKEVL